MNKQVARVIMEFGNKEVTMIRGYQPKSKAAMTTAIRGARASINKAIGNVMLKGDKEERKMVGALLTGDYFEDWDSEHKEVIKY